jgi:hypothetical protein
MLLQTSSLPRRRDRRIHREEFEGAGDKGDKVCLTYVDETASPRKRLSFPRQGWGWKVFDTRGERYDFQYFAHPIFQFDKWLKAEEVLLFAATDGSRYNSGFHIFASKKAAERWCGANDESVLRVRYRGLTFVGRQSTGLASTTVHSAVLVAREIFVRKPRLAAVKRKAA